MVCNIHILQLFPAIKYIMCSVMTIYMLICLLYAGDLLLILGDDGIDHVGVIFSLQRS